MPTIVDVMNSLFGRFQPKMAGNIQIQGDIEAVIGLAPVMGWQ